MNLFKDNEEIEFNPVKGSSSKEILKNILNEDLDFKRDYNYFGKHNWHPFPAKFPPQLPHLFIRHLTRENEVVLDPMMGSCTTLIEAQILGRQAIGFDIDPLSLIIGKSKFINLNFENAKKLGESILNKAYNRFLNNQQLIKSLKNEFDEETKKFIDYWFLEKTQLELMSIITEINSLKNEELRIFFRTILSSVIIAKTGGVSLAQDLAHTRPHKVESKKINSAFEEFSKKLKKLTKDLLNNISKEVLIKKANAKNLPLDANSVDLIVTSPPYANNAIDYIRAHKFSLVWFGYRIENLKKIRKELIGSEVKVETKKLLPAYVQNIINCLNEKNKKKSNHLLKYFVEMDLAIKEMHRVLKKDKAAVIVVASSKIEGIDVQTHLSLAEISKANGFALAGIGEREINRDRRMMPASFNGNNSSQIETRMHKEFIMGLIKE